MFCREPGLVLRFRSCASRPEVDMLNKAADEPHVRKAFQRRVERLLYRSLDALRTEVAEFPNARDLHDA
jgi:hypothetical protein